ncbi:MAG TPA: YdcF family protein [Gemmataceae bacterium]|nr:YdcF family protein [Gemmataceae bacterium]
MYQIFVWNILQPFPIFCMVMALVVANLWRKRKESRARLLWVSIPFVLFLVSCTPVVGWFATRSIESRYPPLRDRPSDAEAIVVLASYVAPPDAIRIRPELDYESLCRCREGAEMFKQGKPCPVIVSGGKPDNALDPDCASAMRDYLVQLGLDKSNVILENRSQTTFENAIECSKLLKALNIHKIILVTSAEHLGRAVGCFRKEGFEVVPCGSCYQATYDTEWPQQIIPSLHAGIAFERACHEWLGTLWYWLRGKI